MASALISSEKFISPAAVTRAACRDEAIAAANDLELVERNNA